ncbi:MAG: hypothetical protein P4M11_00605 [Candidatus Pacebacteria bacterium]|nr:hypothetical protein [Candidatus Paceibacterota bacterium]
MSWLGAILIVVIATVIALALYSFIRSYEDQQIQAATTSSSPW